MPENDDYSPASNKPKKIEGVEYYPTRSDRLQDEQILVRQDGELNRVVISTVDGNNVILDDAGTELSDKYSASDSPRGKPRGIIKTGLVGLYEVGCSF